MKHKKLSEDTKNFKRKNEDSLKIEQYYKRESHLFTINRNKKC